MIDTSKVIHAPVGGGRYTVTAPIVKEDYGLYLKIERLELPSTYEVDFSNSEHNGTSVTMIGNADGVLIPSQFISSGKDVFAFLYHVGVDFGRTVYKFRIPNKVRPDRTNEEPTPEEQSTIDQAINALNTAVEQTAQDRADADVSAQNASADAERAEEARTDAQNYASSANTSSDAAYRSASSAQLFASQAETSAQSAEQSAQSASQSAQDAQDALEEFTTPTASATTLPEGSNATASYSNGNFAFGIPRGDKGERGERGLQGVQGERGLQGETGASGRDGTDGISPTVSVSSITGGHEVSITDAQGTQTFDVMDGTTPTVPVQDVQINGTSILNNGVANIPMPQTVTVTGTTPTITGQADTRYVCGEVSTIDITVPASGIIDVVFTSGSTATVLTVTPPSGMTMKWANGFDPTSLEANTTYEINIMDGIYGVVGTWT